MKENKNVSVSMSRDEKMQKQKDYIHDLKDRQIRAANGEDDGVERVTANRASKSSKKEFQKYTIPAEEADNFVHVRVTRLNQNEAMKRYDEDTRVIPIHAREFDRRVAEGAFATFDEAEVLHDPRANAPETYVLKAGAKEAQLEIDAKGPAADRNIAKRENALKDREKSLAEREQELADREAALKAKEEALKLPTPAAHGAGTGENPAGAKKVDEKK